jgi:hypothetical protein
MSAAVKLDHERERSIYAVGPREQKAACFAVDRQPALANLRG